MTVTIFYSCELCGLKRVPCDVPARGEEDILLWMDATIRLTGRDHARRSPNCHPTKLTDLMIPITGTSKVGGPAIQ